MIKINRFAAGLIGIAGLVVLTFTTPLGLVPSAIQCMISSDCAMSVDSKTIESAISTGDYSACQPLPQKVWFSISQPQQRCLMQIAEDKKDINYCIESKNLSCYVKIAKLISDPSLCKDMIKNLSLDPRDRSASMKNVKDISPDFWQIWANKKMDECYFDMALANNDESLCQFRKTADERLWCKIRISNGDHSVCDQFEKESYKKACLNYLGVETQAN